MIDYRQPTILVFTGERWCWSRALRGAAGLQNGDVLHGSKVTAATTHLMISAGATTSGGAAGSSASSASPSLMQPPPPPPPPPPPAPPRVRPTRAARNGAKAWPLFSARLFLRPPTSSPLPLVVNVAMPISQPLQPGASGFTPAHPRVCVPGLRSNRRRGERPVLPARSPRSWRICKPPHTTA